LLGAVAHTFQMLDATRAMLWKPLYLFLGILVAFFAIGALGDWTGPALARRLLPWGIGLGAAFFAVTQIMSGLFIVFIVYEAAALLTALILYTILAITGRVRGAAVMAVAILLNLAAAGVQASPLSLQLVVPFDHNGLFHLVQMVGTAALGLGVRRGLRPVRAAQALEPSPQLVPTGP